MTVRRQAEVPVTKLCLECAVEMKQGRFQLLRAWSAQLYCSRKCQNKKQERAHKAARKEEFTVPPHYNANGRQRAPVRCVDVEDDESGWIPSGYLTPRQEPPEHIREAVRMRMMRGAVI